LVTPAGASCPPPFHALRKVMQAGTSLKLLGSSSKSRKKGVVVMASNKNANMPEERAVSDAADPRTLHTDPNGAGTAVGVPHPENRKPQSRRDELNIDLDDVELNDYDTYTPPRIDVDPDENEGRSFENIVDVGETPGDEETAEGHRPPSGRIPGRYSDDEDLETSDHFHGTVDNQTNQPKAFHNRDR
jgi:hypothetical protein